MPLIRELRKAYALQQEISMEDSCDAIRVDKMCDWSRLPGLDRRRFDSCTLLMRLLFREIQASRRNVRVQMRHENEVPKFQYW